ncbi:MAG: serine/threonine protein kinase [Clostridiales bacterium]|nr:serine/threonine protein kinase [Clostridiales bacterium]
MAVIGSVIDDKYEILKLIGQGGMSRVYLAMDKRLNKQWAVKEVTKNPLDKNNDVIVRSAIAEANMMKRLDHPSLPRIVDVIENARFIYVVMDYIEGETLDKILREDGAQKQESVIEWAKQLCKALYYLHTCKPPIIYRDMKPANIILQPNGDIKLLDFGIAREYKEQSDGDTVSLGTKGYAAPEQFGGKGQTDQRTDIYSLGVTLYHIVTGQNPCEPPYELYPIRQWNPTLSGGLELIIQTCAQLNPDDRYQSCADLLYTLNRYEEIDDSYRARQTAKLRGFIAVAIAAVIFMGVGVTGMTMRTLTDNADYANNLELGEKASNDAEKIDYYLKAIDIKPAAKEAYMSLIETFKYDAAFTIAEEEQLKKKINANLTALRASPDYADIAFEIGRIYWHYYDYGKTELSDNQITRMKSAIQWFEDAALYGAAFSDYYQMAVIYRDIGKFNRDITLDIEEASDKGKYRPYFDNIRELLSMSDADSGGSEIVRLELYRLVIYSVETYARKFKMDGVTERELQEAFDSARGGTENILATTEKTDEIKNNVTNRFEDAQKAIISAYANKEGGGA